MPAIPPLISLAGRLEKIKPFEIRFRLALHTHTFKALEIDKT